MLKSLLTTGFLVSIYGIGQHFGIDNSYWIQDSTLRVFATLGQPNWLAAWLLLLLPFSWLFFFSTKKRGRNLLYATLTLVLFTSFWFTYSLSGLLGLGVTVSVFLILRSPKYFLAKWKKTLFLSLGYFSIILLNLGPLKERARKTIKHMTQKEAAYAAEYIPPTERGDTLKIRKLVWQGAIDLWKSTPKNIVLGTGPETFAYAFLAFRPQQLNNTSEWDFLYNRAHNEYIDILCEHGLLAFGAYTYLIIKFIHYATKKKKPNASQNLSSALVSGWVGLLVTNFFGFSVVPTALLFWLYPAICICVKN
ncbi:MAG: O-antigen ligase family protein [Patescibacteria group bacterium]